MQSSTTAKDSHRQLLMHCQVTNALGESTHRFIDFATFSLWQFYVQQKYNFTISQNFACIWVPENEMQQHQRLFEHADFLQPVTRITLENFDEQTGITQCQTRFVPTADLATVAPLLERHWLQTTNALLMASEAGGAISTTPATYTSTWRSTATSHAA